MKRIFAACAVLLALSVPAWAQSTAPIFDWSSFYLGGTAGGGWGKTHFIGQFPWDFHADGFAAGVGAAYNWQAGPWVLGIETDISASDIKGSLSNDSSLFDCVPGCSIKAQWFGTTRLRIGYAIGNLLPYITGGLAYARIRADFSNTKVNESGSSTKTDAVFGAGLEWMINSQWSAKVEYLHFDFGSFNYSKDFASVAGPGTAEASMRFDTVRAGINYRFSTR